MVIVAENCLPSISAPNYANLLKANSCLTQAYKVSVLNGLPQGSSPLKLHCASGNDDLGFHTLNINQDFSWKFCESIIQNTLFFCHLWWGSKNIAFDAFSSNSIEDCPEGVCLWVAKSDGIYFRFNVIGQLEKKYSWQ
ncbi:S-protein-like protein 1 [Forsythia ovata]|uniref:S-protein homolog n=1 Tax=Forsythia ovata TaxID=205694 RepID=A0ABD1P7N1_9LAMI